ncbi:Fic family protein [Myxococcota bacterium]|nr:Fic family protein [Myxococcota bacterium]MBU1534841.1 Fic family protein [Myxococcota bacterium]
MAKHSYPTVIDQAEIKILEKRIISYREVMSGLPEEEVRSLMNFLDITWCYHEFAIEGIVLNHLEIKSALDDRIISDSSLIPHYDDVKCFYEGVKRLRVEAQKKRLSLSVNSIKELHTLISEPGSSKQNNYRKEIPLHRQYAHDFSPPEKIPYRMRKLGEFLQSQSFRKMPPLLKAASAHNKIMAIFPWSKKSGTLARLVMNLILLHSEYPVALIPDVERQTYYDNIQVDLTHDSDIRMVNFLNESICLFLNAIAKRLNMNI